jgi:thymidylate kinase
VIIEIVGPTGAGKSTLARLLSDALGGPQAAPLASDLVLRSPVLRRLGNAQVANLVQDARGLPHLARTLPAHADLLRLSATMLRRHAPTRLDLVLNARSVLRRLGMYELARSKSGGRPVILDEGPLLIAYHLFVYSTADPRHAPLDAFAAALPRSDLVVYLRSPLPVLVARAFSRPDRRRQLAKLTAAETEAPLRRARDVFDRLTAMTPLAERTVVLDNDSDDPRALLALARQLARTVRPLQAGPAVGEADPRPAMAR